tara:strand:- start:50 stop:568 length:519 start_codon:yes stop_codon:yes gene_type:complete
MMRYGSYQSAEEYEEAIREERERNPDTLFDVVAPTKYMQCKFGLANLYRDFELRYGTPIWKRYGAELESRLPNPVRCPAGEPLNSIQKIIRFRSKQRMDRFTLEGFNADEVKDAHLRSFLTQRLDGVFTFKDFRHAYNYAQGKPAKLRWAENITIKADRKDIPQLHKWSGVQ